MQKSLVMGAAAIILTACADRIPTALDGREARELSISEDDPRITFEITGFTYGGDGLHLEDAQFPKCAKGGSSQTDTIFDHTWVLTTSSGNTLTFREILTLESHVEPCSALSANQPAEPYFGGTISIEGLADGGGIGLGSTPAKWDVIRTVEGLPVSADVRLTAYPQPSGNCPNPVFSHWIIDQAWNAPVYGNPLVMPGAQIANRNVSGEFICEDEDQPPPPPDDDPPPPYCDDPETCEDGGGSLRSDGSTKPLTIRKPSRPNAGRKKIF